jgi:hypothetical protein
VADRPRRFDIDAGIVFVGAQIVLQFRVEDSADPPAAQVMTGWALEFKVSVDPETTTAALISKTTGSGITIGNGTGTNDQASVSLQPADTWSSSTFVVDPGDYWYSLRRTDSGFETPLIWGKIRIAAIPGR